MIRFTFAVLTSVIWVPIGLGIIAFNVGAVIGLINGLFETLPTP